jgi:hypothetical protein
VCKLYTVSLLSCLLVGDHDADSEIILTNVKIMNAVCVCPGSNVMLQAYLTQFENGVHSWIFCSLNDIILSILTISRLTICHSASAASST